MPQASTDAVLLRLASCLKVTPAMLPADWPPIAAQALAVAETDLDSILDASGYSGAQSAAADQRRAWVEQIALVVALEMGSVLTNYSTEQLKLLDPRERLAKMAFIRIGGKPVAPDGASPVGGAESGTLSAVQESAADATLRGLFR